MMAVELSLLPNLLDQFRQPIRRTQKAPCPRASKRQNSSKIRVSEMSPQMSFLMNYEAAKHHILAEKYIFHDNF